jgi:hypothetical protein
MYSQRFLQPLELFPDGAFLHRQLDKIRLNHFPACPLTSIAWGIPAPVSVRRVIQEPTPNAPQDLEIRLAECRSLIALGRWSAAATALQPLADAGVAEAERLLSHALRRLGGQWEMYAKRYAERVSNVQLTPASSHNRQLHSITLHSCLAHRQAPQFVLNYLIYLECAHATFPPADEGNPHPDFLALEATAPARTKAQKWLARQGFPVFRKG